MTRTQTVAALAEATGLTKPEVKGFLEAQAKLAYVGAKEGYTIAGIGKLVLVNRKARMGRNPATGEAIHIPAKTVVKFRVAKVCKESVLSV
jgi:DNA-binding protein HU-beta